MDLSGLSVDGLVASLVVGSVGLGVFLHGRKLARLPHMVIGATMMVFPYFVPRAGPMLGVFALLVAGLWLLGRHG